MAALLVLEFLLYQHMTPTPDSIQPALLRHQRISSPPNALEEDYPTSPLRIKRKHVPKWFQVVFFSYTLIECMCLKLIILLPHSLNKEAEKERWGRRRKEKA